MPGAMRFRKLHTKRSLFSCFRNKLYSIYTFFQKRVRTAQGVSIWPLLWEASANIPIFARRNPGRTHRKWPKRWSFLQCRSKPALNAEASRTFQLQRKKMHNFNIWWSFSKFTSLMRRKLHNLEHGLRQAWPQTATLLSLLQQLYTCGNPHALPHKASGFYTSSFDGSFSICNLHCRKLHTKQSLFSCFHRKLYSIYTLFEAAFLYCKGHINLHVVIEALANMLIFARGNSGGTHQKWPRRWSFPTFMYCNVVKLS